MLRSRFPSRVKLDAWLKRSLAGERGCVRTNETQTFVEEPGRTADPSAALGMTKGSVNASMYGGC
jgi:hypothetical protein